MFAEALLLKTTEMAPVWASATATAGAEGVEMN
jgi:hypothetical protein